MAVQLIPGKRWAWHLLPITHLLEACRESQAIKVIQWCNYSQSQTLFYKKLVIQKFIPTYLLRPMIRPSHFPTLVSSSARIHLECSSCFRECYSRLIQSGTTGAPSRWAVDLILKQTPHLFIFRCSFEGKLNVWQEAGPNDEKCIECHTVNYSYVFTVGVTGCLLHLGRRRRSHWNAHSSAESDLPPNRAVFPAAF